MAYPSSGQMNTPFLVHGDQQKYTADFAFFRSRRRKSAPAA
jgi:hypothetical protein